MIGGKRTLSDPLDSSISGSTRVVLGVPIYNSKHKVIGALGGSYDVTALSRMLFEDLFDGQGCSMIIAQNGEVIAFEGDTSYWNLDYRYNFYKYCCKWIIKDRVTVKKIRQDFKEGKGNLITAESKKKGPEGITFHTCQWGSMAGLSAMQCQNRQHNSNMTLLKSMK